MYKRIGIGVFLVVFAVLGWLIYQRLSSSTEGISRQRRRPPVAVETISIRTTTIRDTGNFSGTLQPISKFLLAPKTAGRLEKILANIGDTVESGQLVAVLDDAEYRQQVIQAKAELEVARANLKERQNTLANAKREYDRTIALRTKKIASESQLDAADSEYKTQQAKLDVALAQLSQKEAALKVAEVRLSYTQVRVPGFDHNSNRVVGERFVDEGALLSANMAIVSILDIGTLIAVIHVIERDYPNVRPGLAAAITTDAYPGSTFQGQVARIAPLLKENSREARVEIDLENSRNLLKPGMFVRVAIEFGLHTNATVIPRDALVKRDGVQGIFTVNPDGQTVRFVPVEMGIIGGSEVEILDPPISGEVVILGHHLLEDGSTILVPGNKPSEAPASKRRKPGKG
jgi:RND family efflux transporter MFP subunit